VDLPTVRVSTRLPGASPAEMEAQVSQPIEEAINTIEGIKELRSVNGSGISFIIVTFELDRDIDAAAQDVRDRVATVLRDLPRDADPPTISKSDNDQSPVLSLALSGNRSQRELTEIADKIVKTQIERSPGVGEVEIVGGLERAINVWVDADRLAAYQIPITSVRDAVERQGLFAECYCGAAGIPGLRYSLFAGCRPAACLNAELVERPDRRQCRYCAGEPQRVSGSLCFEPDRSCSGY